MNRAESRDLMQALVDEKKLPLIEVHMLIPSGPALLNRDFNGRVKLIKFGGVDRVRISSPAKRHPIRKKEYTDNATHSRRLPLVLAEKLEKMGKDMEYINAAKDAMVGKWNTEQILAFSDHDVDEIANIITSMITSAKDFKEKIWDDCKKALIKNAGERAVDDITCLMGRMSTDTHIVQTIEAASHLSHMYSIDAWHGDHDLFTAADDLNDRMGEPGFIKFLDGMTDDKDSKKVSDQGAAFLDDSDIAANVFYGYTSISTRTLLENKLRNIDKEDKEGIKKAVEESRNIIRNYIRDYIYVMPEAKQTSNATAPVPFAVLITAGTEVYPMTADSSFEKVIVGNEHESVAEQGVKRLAEFADDLVEGDFAVNEYQKMFWISPKYSSKPESCKEINLNAAIDEILTIVGE